MKDAIFIAYGIALFTVAEDRESSMSEVVVGQIVLFLTTLVGFAYQLYVQKRNRKWDLEDRKAIAEALAKKVMAAETATVLAHESIAAKIDENTAISIGAFREANTFNEKLIKLTQMFEGGPVATTLERVDETTQKTLEEVRKDGDAARP